MSPGRDTLATTVVMPGGCHVLCWCVQRDHSCRTDRRWGGVPSAAGGCDDWGELRRRAGCPAGGILELSVQPRRRATVRGGAERRSGDASHGRTRRYRHHMSAKPATKVREIRHHTATFRAYPVAAGAINGRPLMAMRVRYPPPAPDVGRQP
jgi:hypothetical protein